MDRLAAMQAFVQVVDSGSFSAAARRLNVGQPALSKSVAQLEDRLGVKLLVRSTRGLTPTEAGLNFYERARRSIEEADEAESAARGAGAVWPFRRQGVELTVALRGRLQVSAAEGLRAAVFANAGIAITSEWMFAPEIADGTVKAVLEDWKLPPMDLWAVFPAGRTPT